MKSALSDTSREMQRMHFKLMSGVPAEQRLRMALELTQAGRHLVLADIQQRYQNADENEIRRRFIARILPRPDVLRVYGFDPKDDEA